jgi:hypothetical protein
MRAFESAGARQVERQQNRRNEPDDEDRIEGGRDTAEDKHKGHRGKCREPANQTGRNEGAVTRACEDVVAHRRMHQRTNVIANRRKNTHVDPTHVRLADALP